MTEEKFSEDFADFYTENIEVYGDSEEGLEEAYADFTQELGLYGEGVNEEIDAFSEYYSDMVDVYGDSEEGLEEAYADFMELANAEEEAYADGELTELEEQFVEYYSDLADVYGDSEEGLEEAYADFIEAVESAYAESDEDTTYSEEDLIEEFADFYADTEDIYGDDVEAAFDDYTDALEALAEDSYSSDKAKKNMEVAKSYGKHALAGGVVGAAVAGTGKVLSNAGKEFDRLKNRKSYLLSKGLANLNNQEHVELREIDATLKGTRWGKSARKGATKAMLKGAGVGAGLAVAGKATGLTEDIKKFSDEDEYASGDSDSRTSMAQAIADKKRKATFLPAVIGTDKTKDKPGIMSKAWNKTKKGANSNAGRAAIGATGGAAVGAGLAALTDPNSKERKALKAKVKAGTASDQDKARLAELQKMRRNRLLKAGGVGAVAGGAAGYGSKGIAAAASQMNSNRKAKTNLGSGVKSSFRAGMGYKDKEASAEDKDLLLGNKEDRNFSASDKRPNDAGSYVAGLIKG
jgi:hypothetical protein